jgi:ferrous-iron efflux pump FieF
MYLPPTPPALRSIHAQAAEEKSQSMRHASMVTLSGVALLIVIKVVAWVMTGSLSLLSSLVDSSMDLLASLTNFFAIRYALVPPDHEHRFGHGKVEYIAGMGQALFISATAVFVAIEAVRRFFSPVAVSHGAIGIGVMVVSILVTLAMVTYQKRAILRTDSTALKADYTHYVMDVLSGAAVIVALVLSYFLGWTWADPLFALLVSGYILYGAWEVGFGSFQNLMDREFEDAERQSIAKAVVAVAGVQGVHELKTRRSGLLSFIQLHIDVDGQLSLSSAHDICEEVERAVRVLYPHAEVLVHMDPA